MSGGWTGIRRPQQGTPPVCDSCIVPGTGLGRWLCHDYPSAVAVAAAGADDGSRHRGRATTTPESSRPQRPGAATPRSLTPTQLYAEVRVHDDIIPAGTVERRIRQAMQPRYITIHSTQNPTGDAYAHAQALKRGTLRGGRRTGYLFWHYTVQDDVVIQHLPTDEAGEHADRDGPGNRFSIGIEMCEHQGNDLARTIDRTATLTAWLMWAHAIPLAHVVPHHYWPREGYTPPHKNCPHFLLDDAYPGAKWQRFLALVQAHYQRLGVPSSQAGAPPPPVVVLATGVE